MRGLGEIQTALYDVATGLAARIVRDSGSYTVALLSVTGFVLGLQFLNDRLHQRIVYCLRLKEGKDSYLFGG